MKWRFEMYVDLVNAAALWLDNDGGTEEEFLDYAQQALHACIESPTSYVPNAGGFWLYRLYNEAGRLIYVGVTANPRSRLSAHRRRFGALLDHWTFDEYQTREDVLAAEADAIEFESPAFNVTHPEVSDGG